jgi:Flp pilus assembly protein TadD
MALLAFFNYAENYKNLAWVYIAKGDKEGAVKLARKAVQMTKHLNFILQSFCSTRDLSTGR